MRKIISVRGVKVMHVISLIVKNEFGVMQRVMGEFTRNKINVETIVVGKCEVPGKSRMVLSVIDKDAADTAMGRLEKLQDVYDAELIPSEGQSAYALMSTSDGNVGLVGGAAQVEEIIERSRSEKYVMALNAL
jgi:acetolactate synthase-1/3 small subunit